MGEINVEEVINRNSVKIGHVYQHCQGYLQSSGKTLTTSPQYFTEQLRQNLTRTINWSGNIYFSGLIKDKKTDDIHIDMDFYLSPIRERYDTTKPEENLLREIFKRTTKHLVILGEGGSGKSTSMQMLSRKMLTDNADHPEYSIPLVLRFRECNKDLDHLNKHVTESDGKPFSTYKGNLLFYTLYKELGLLFKNKTENESSLLYDLENGFLKRFVIKAFDFLSPVIILDGFDEISYDLRPKIFHEIEELCFSLTSTRVIVTSRTGEFEYIIANAHKFQLAPFNDKKIESFCNAWLKDKGKGKILFEEIRNSPFYDATIRPINLTLLATLFESTGYLPPKPRSVYRDIIDLHIIKWDKTRDILRISNVSNFDPSIKFEFLSHLAFHLSKENLIVFDRYKLEYIYKKILSFRFSLDPEQFDKVINEIETHSGLFIQSGRDTFEFPHKSIQEYLTGEYLTRYQPIFELKEVVLKLPNELAIATSLSNNPNYLFTQAINIFLKGNSARADQFFIYLGRVVSEKIDFTPRMDFGYELLSLWEELFGISNNTELYKKFFNLKGVMESIALVEEIFRIDPETYLDIRNLIKNVPNIDELKLGYKIQLQLRDRSKYSNMYKTKITVPLFCVIHWKYMHKYFS